jgi:hypothetical protein
VGTNSGFDFVFGTSASDVWIVAPDYSVFQWDGTGWHDRSSTVTINGYVYGPERIWGTGPASLWGISYRGIFRWNGASWSMADDRWRVLTSISGTSDTDIWAVGFDGTIVHYDGVAWTQITSPTTQHLSDVWAAAPNDAWAVGTNSTLLRWDGTQWTNIYPVSGSMLFEKVQAIGPNEALILNDSREILRWNGTDVFHYGLGQSGWTYDFWALGPNDVWAVGFWGTVEHFDGTSWVDVDAQAGLSMSGVWAAPNGDVWAALPNSSVLRRKAP